MIVSAVRGLVSLAVDAVECLLVLGAGGYARVDELWADTRTAAADRLADAEAEHEVTEPKCDCGLTPDLTDLDRHGALCTIWDDWELSGDDDNPYAACYTSPSSAAGEPPDPAAERQEESPSPAVVETPPGLQLTAEELDAAQFVVRRWSRGSRFDDDRVSREFFERLADKLDPAKR